MRRVRIEVSATVRAEDEAAAADQIRSALAVLRTFGLEIRTEDLGPVESQTIQPQNVIQKMTGR